MKWSLTTLPWHSSKQQGAEVLVLPCSDWNGLGAEALLCSRPGALNPDLVDPLLSKTNKSAVSWHLTRANVWRFCVHLLLSEVTDFSVFVSIFSVFLWYLMSHSNVSKMLFLISWELRKQTASELWRLQGNFYSVKSLVLKGIFLNALCVLCTSFKGARARKENTHANIALVRGNCSTFLVLILKVKTIACHNDAIFWLKANGLVWDEGHLEGLLLLVKGGGESGGKSLPCNCFSSLRKLAVSETR